MRKLVPKRKSPLTAAPLRNPGQSLDEEIERLINDDFVYHLVATTYFFVLAFWEWLKWYTQWPPQPIALTAMAFSALILMTRKIVAVRRRVRLLKVARDGERAVGQYLDNLREKGYRVLHDLVGDRFNIDHVLIGPAGVFTVETKTISKPNKGQAVIEYDGEHLTVDGFIPDRDPIIQGKAQAGWLRELVMETTGKDFPVRSIVLYPGWFVKASAHRNKVDVLVLNPKALPSLLEKSNAKLTLDDIKLITYHLSRHIRTGP